MIQAPPTPKMIVEMLLTHLHARKVERITSSVRQYYHDLSSSHQSAFDGEKMTLTHKQYDDPADDVRTYMRTALINCPQHATISR